MNILRASAKGDLAAVKKFVADSVNVNTTDPSGRTALIEAAWAGHAEVVKYLLEKGANVNAQDNAGFSALMRAAEEGHAPAVSLLLNKGAAPNMRGKVRGITPLMLAAERGHQKIIELLLAKGAKINLVDQHMETALAYACRMNQTKVARFLESKGGRGKPERSTHSHGSSRDRGGQTIARSMLPSWSAAFESTDIADEGEEEGAPSEASDEMFEE